MAAWLAVKTLKQFQCGCKLRSSLTSFPQFQKHHYRLTHHRPRRLLALQSEENYFVRPDPSKPLLPYRSYRDPRHGDFMTNIKNFSKFLHHQFYNPDKLTLHFSAYKTSQDGTLTLDYRFTKTLTQPLFDGTMAGKPFMLSCRGFVCIASWSVTNPPILICNPSTQELISLPPNNEPNLRVGFGYAASTQNFKVVRFFADTTKKTTRCQVFTLGTSQWREAEGLPYLVCDGTAPFLHGAVHCLSETSESGVRKTDAIVAFDIETEQYTKVIPLPSYYHSLGDCGKSRGIIDPRNFMRLSLLKGSLCLTFDFGELKCYLKLWLLKDYEKVEWVEGHTIDVSSIYPYPSYSFWAYPTDNLVDKTILLNCSDEQGIKLLGYDPKRGVVKLKRDKKWAATYF